MFTPISYRDAKDQGSFAFEPIQYGISEMGIPLTYFPSSDDCRLLVFAGIHGEEPETTFLLSRALRCLCCLPSHVAIVLCANPDGMLRGTRGNIHGVDLNRNFPALNWSSEPVLTRLMLESPRETRLSPGVAPQSEAETRALLSLISVLNPRAVIAMHAPIGCVDSAIHSSLVQTLEAIFGLPWEKGLGYQTPGSFGTWAEEASLDSVTLELPRMALELLAANYAPLFAKFIAEFY